MAEASCPWRSFAAGASSWFFSAHAVGRATNWRQKFEKFHLDQRELEMVMVRQKNRRSPGIDCGFENRLVSTRPTGSERGIQAALEATSLLESADVSVVLGILSPSVYQLFDIPSAWLLDHATRTIGPNVAI